MKSCRTDIERLIPTLRQFARALVESHRADIADDLVHEALDEAIRGERETSARDIDVRLFARIVVANRLRLRAEADDRRSLPGISARGDIGASRHAGAAASPPRGSDQGLDRLMLSDREAILLVVLGRLDYVKAAEVIGVPVATLIARLTHARDALGACLWSGPSALPKPRGPVGHLRLVKS